MGYMIATGNCLGCKNLFSFNPTYVPSLNDKPICKNCVEAANQAKKKLGMEELTIHPEAYKFQKEDA